MSPHMKLDERKCQIVLACALCQLLNIGLNTTQSCIQQNVDFWRVQKGDISFWPDKMFFIV